MNTYITRTGQNIYDISIQLFGTVEGVLDLLVCNTSMEVLDYGPQELAGQPLTLNTTLSRGIKLYYHETANINDDTLDFVDENNLIIANGEHTITLPNIDPQQICIIVDQTGKTSTFRGSLLSGELHIDWGDYSQYESMIPTDDYEFEHVYKSSGNHTIKFWGKFIGNVLDLSDINGIIYITAPIITKKWIGNGTEDPELIITVGDGYFTIDVDMLDTKMIQ